jgi:hypothetical protein
MNREDLDTQMVRRTEGLTRSTRSLKNGPIRYYFSLLYLVNAMLTWYRVLGLDYQPRTYAGFEKLHALFYHLGAGLYHGEFDKYHIIAVSPHSQPESFICYKPT